MAADREYKRVVKEILETGEIRDDRTGTGTKSIFGARMTLDISESFPLLTTKRIFFRGVVEELLWILRGSTNANELASRDVHIWDGHSSRKHLDSLGFYDRETGEVGPMYGFQWRRWGEKYSGNNSDVENSGINKIAENNNMSGIDQIAELLTNIKKDPFSRRHVLSAWNVSDIPLMSLPPCHVLSQFYVSKKTDENNLSQYILSLQVYQRSADMGLGIPFNIASYALLLHIFCHILEMSPGKLIYVIGDAHIYRNHIEALSEQIQREPRSSPQLKILCGRKNDPKDYNVDDFEIVGYDPHAPVKMEMSV